MYTITSLYNSGITFKKNPHYSFFLPSQKYILKIINNNVNIQNNDIKKIDNLKGIPIFERTFTNKHNIQMSKTYILNNFINFINFLPYKLKKESLYNFSKYKEFDGLKYVENPFTQVQVLNHEDNIIVYQAKTKKHYWIHLPFKYNIIKISDDNTTSYILMFIPLYKYYSNYIIQMKITSNNNNQNVTFSSCIKQEKTEHIQNNSFHYDIIKNISKHITYDIINAIDNNINILYMRNVKPGKYNFINTTNALQKKTKNYKKKKFTLPSFKSLPFKFKRT